LTPSIFPYNSFVFVRADIAGAAFNMSLPSTGLSLLHGVVFIYTIEGISLGSPGRPIIDGSWRGIGRLRFFFSRFVIFVTQAV